MSFIEYNNRETVEAKLEDGVTELVRGQEAKLLDRLQPLVRRQSVTLELSGVERIDAAGLAALITIYCDACKAGNRFTVSQPSRHVREILGLVGLERILMAQSEAGTAFECAQLAETAA
jgi:anti-anti-sigma factor